MYRCMYFCRTSVKHVLTLELKQTLKVIYSPALLVLMLLMQKTHNILHYQEMKV